MIGERRHRITRVAPIEPRSPARSVTCSCGLTFRVASHLEIDSAFNWTHRGGTR